VISIITREESCLVSSAKKYPPESFMNRIKEDTLGYPMVMIAGSFLGTALGLTDMNPVRSLIASTFEPSHVDKGFQENETNIVEIQPVPDQKFGIDCQNLGSQVRNLYPRQNQEANIVGYLMEIAHSGLLIPSDKQVTILNLPSGRTPSDAGHNLAVKVCDVFEIGPDDMRMPQIMMGMDQVIP
jgi:hypothetical protein